MTSPVRIGLIGLGRWGRTYVKTLAELGERCRISHVCTSRPEQANDIPPSVSRVSDWQAIVRSDCEAVIIATPPATHSEIMEACLERRKPCLVEKPLCMDVATAERLHRRVGETNVPVLVNHVHLFDPAYAALKHALERAGKPIRLILSEGAALGPFREHTTALWDWAPHDASLCLDLMGRQPDRAEALAGPRGPDGAPEQVSLRFDFSGGACAWVHTGRLSTQKRRGLSVFTDTQLYVLNQQASERLIEATIDFPRRYAGGIPEPLSWTPIALPSDRQPLASAVLYFLDGLAGGDRHYFGTQLALDVTRLLAQCESQLAGGT